MPSYFYHLAFELYPSENISLEASATEDSERIYLPPSNADIFSTPLPVHKIASWGGEKFERKSHRRTKTETVYTDRPKRRAISFDTPAQDDWPCLPGSTAAENRQSLQSGAVGVNVSGGFPPPSGARDWRFEQVCIQSIDMEQNNSQGRPRGKSMTQGTHAGTSSGGAATRGRFIPSDPKNTDVGWGVVHLYRDAQETPGLYDDTASSAGSDGETVKAKSFNENDCTTLCILAVPSYMTPSDLLGFVGEQTREDVSHFRLIRTGRANKYMVLMKFREAQKAKTWRNNWNGRPFNSMESEYCHVVFVKSITFETSDTLHQPTSYPDMNNDPFKPKTQPNAKADSPSSLSAPLTTKPLPPPTADLVELPTCPVCLERMDETTGLLTILCQHVFHCACLEKWRGSGCPVCRYTQNNSIPGRIHSAGSPDDTENLCSICGTDQNLWICLICGNVGCGRYDSAHAFAHYEATRHSFAMDIETQHVWDYAGDGYVHRLIQNKADGKLVDLPAARGSSSAVAKRDVNGGMAAFGADMVPREKMEAMGNEYAYLLTNQLESQRLYYEGQLERAVDKASTASAAAEKALAQLDALEERFARLQADYDDAKQGFLSLERDVEKARKRAEKADELARKLGKDWREEKTINESLMDKVKFLDAKVKEGESKREQLEAEKKELQEQNRDLTFFISGGEKLKDMGEEAIEGKIEVPVAEQGGGGKKRKGKKR